MRHCRQRLHRKRKKNLAGLVFPGKYFFAIVGWRWAWYMAVKSPSSSFWCKIFCFGINSRDSLLLMSFDTDHLCYAWSLSNAVARETTTCPIEAAVNAASGLNSRQLKTTLCSSKIGTMGRCQIGNEQKPGLKLLCKFSCKSLTPSLHPPNMIEHESMS